MCLVLLSLIMDSGGAADRGPRRRAHDVVYDAHSNSVLADYYRREHGHESDGDLGVPRRLETVYAYEQVASGRSRGYAACYDNTLGHAVD